jgi:hypothetical protein
MARVFLKMALAATLLLAAGLALSGCQTTGSGTGAAKAPAAAPAAPAAPGAQADPVAELGQRMFLLPDGRDMSYIVLRVTRLGVSEAAVRKAAQELAFADFRSWLNETAQAHRVSYLGSGRFQVDALNFVLGHESFAQAGFMFHLTRFSSAGRTIDGIILDQVVLDGRDLTAYAGMKVYELLLERKAGI